MTYQRGLVVKRQKRWIQAMEKWLQEIDNIVALLLTKGQIEKAEHWTLLYHSLSIARDLWRKLLEEL